jgi:hypothetical protein
MEINYITIVGAGVLSMIIGSIWYGPLFGKKWMEICGVTEMDKERRAQMQKEALPLYLTQFALTLVQLYVLSNLFAWTGEASKTVGIAFFMWLGFVMPTIAGCAMWNNNSGKVKWAQFLIQSGYQLIMFLLYGYILGMWG